MPWASRNPFLRGAYAPVFDERDDHDLPVRGEIPPTLSGVVMRNGPNPQFEPDDRYVYPFDGTSMIHAVYLENGRARYRNRWVLTKELLAERTAGRRLYSSTFGPPPHANLANTNIIHHGGKYLALYEGGEPHEIDRDLNTVGPFNYGGALPSVMSAHPKLDPTTGELLAISYDLASGRLTYMRADKTGWLTRVVPFQAPWPAMVHDIAITDRHVVAFVCPLVFDMSRRGPPATWQPDKGTAVAVVPRDAEAATDVRWITGAPFFHFHTMNAFSDGDRIEVQLPWFESYSLSGANSKLELHRIVIRLDHGTVEDQAIDDRACEFPHVNDAYLGRQSRYGYVALRDPRPGEAPQVGAFEALARYDLATGTKVIHRFPVGMTVGEPVFVPDPAGAAEGDGFILAFAYDAIDDSSSLAMLDARHLAGAPLAMVRLARRVPVGLHGAWLPA
jgi:carotenoid cleavage dioxygenase-like enzyme